MWILHGMLCRVYFSLNIHTSRDRRTANVGASTETEVLQLSAVHFHSTPEGIIKASMHISHEPTYVLFSLTWMCFICLFVCLHVWFGGRGEAEGNYKGQNVAAKCHLILNLLPDTKITLSYFLLFCLPYPWWSSELPWGKEMQQCEATFTRPHGPPGEQEAFSPSSETQPDVRSMRSN